MTFILTMSLRIIVTCLTNIFHGTFGTIFVLKCSINIEHKKFLNPFSPKSIKNFQSQIIPQKSVFAALCFEVKNRVFSEKEMDSLFKNGQVWGLSNF